MSAGSQLPQPWLRPFSPRRWLRYGHLQTIFGNYLRRSNLPMPPGAPMQVPAEPAHMTWVDSREVEIPATSLLCIAHWQPEALRRDRLTVLLLHGLEGSANSGYMLGNTARLWAEGWNVVRMNMRSCGEGETLAPTIYHSGRSEDVAAIVDHLQAMGCARIAIVGYSMGGNLVLRYAGEQSALPPERRNRALVAVAGVSPLMDLAPSSAALHLPQNRFYERRFLRAMKRRLRRKATLFPALYGTLEHEGVYARMRTMRDFDGEIVARFGGFHDADDYYERARASRFASTFALPTLILHALDDPFIRTLAETRAMLLANPHVDYVETERGGHCAFLAEPGAADGDRWAEETVARWLLHRTQR